MAQGAKTSGTRRRQGGSSRNGKGRSSGERPALSARRKENDSNLEYRRYVQREEQDPAGPPDVLLDVPELKVDLIHFELDDLDAHVALKAKVLNLVKLNVGVDVHLSMVKLDIKGVEAQVVLKARLDHVTAIVDRLMTSLDRNPELVKGLSKAVAEVGEGAGQAVGKTGDAAKDLGKGAQSALGDVGKGPGRRQATSARARARPSATSARAPARRWASSARAPARPPATSTRSSEASARPSARRARAPRVRSEASPGAAGAAEAAARPPARPGRSRPSSRTAAIPPPGARARSRRRRRSCSPRSSAMPRRTRPPTWGWPPRARCARWASGANSGGPRSIAPRRPPYAWPASSASTWPRWTAPAARAGSPSRTSGRRRRSEPRGAGRGDHRGRARRRAADRMQAGRRRGRLVTSGRAATAERHSERVNLPDTLEEGTTYRDFAAWWHAAARLKD